MTKDSAKIVPVILSGGAGTRLWPMSTADCPKQFLALAGQRTMFQDTVLRVVDAERFSPPLIVANARHADLIDQQLHEIGVAAGGVILEPSARNTAPAIALAALEAAGRSMLVMPSDHVIADPGAFVDAVQRALPLVEQGWLATFGIAPDKPETGFGYIQIGASIGNGVHRVERFIEKPALEQATRMLADGGHAWNGGIFLFGADAFLAELERQEPAIASAARAAMAKSVRSGGRILPDGPSFAAAPSNSIDYAVMEHAAQVAVVPVAMGWSDLGSWDALYDMGDKDSAGNHLRGDVRLIDGSGNLMRTDGIRISATGVDDLIIIASGNEVMILPRGQSQLVKKFSA